MRFFRKKELILDSKVSGKRDTVLQPLAVAIVSAILVALILIMGFLDIRRSKANLVGFLEDQALSTISVLQRLTEENLKSIIAAPDKKSSRLASPSREEATYSKRWVIEAITDLGKKSMNSGKKAK